MTAVPPQATTAADDDFCTASPLSRKKNVCKQHGVSEHTMENASKVYGCPYLRALLLFITLNSLVLVCVSELVFVLVDALWYSGRQQFKLGNK